MGYLTNGVCYETLNEAIDYYYSALPAINEYSSTKSYYAYYAKTASGWVLNQFTYSSSGAMTVLTPVNVSDGNFFASCTYETPASNEAKFADGVTIGWGIAAAMAIAYSYKLIQRAIS